MSWGERILETQDDPHARDEANVDCPMSNFPYDLFNFDEPMEGFSRRSADLANLPLWSFFFCGQWRREREVIGVALMKIILKPPMAPLNISVAVEQSE